MIRVLTYNIHGARGIDGKRDYHRIGQFLKIQNIHIALIQELDTRPKAFDSEDVLAALKTDHFQYFAAAPTLEGPQGWYGNAILSKYPILKQNVIDISALGREPRNILETFIETPEGPLHVVTTHKGLRSLERQHQMTKLYALLSRKSDIPLIVGGDINQWHARSEALDQLNSALCPLETGPTFPTRFPLFHLDRLWVRPQQLVQTSSVLKTKESRLYSDHYPVLAEIQIPQKTVQSTSQKLDI